MREKIEKIIVIIMLVILLEVNFRTNNIQDKNLIIDNAYNFENFQADSEYLVLSKIYENKFFEEKTKYGLSYAYGPNETSVDEIEYRIVKNSPPRVEIEMRRISITIRVTRLYLFFPL